MRTLVALASVALVVSACGSTEPKVLHGEGTGDVLVGGDSNGGADVLIVGETGMVGDCLGVLAAFGPVLVVWPAGTTIVDGDRPSVDVPDIGRVEVGQQVAIAAGYERAPYPPVVPAIPAGCPADQVAVANSDQSR